MVICYNLQGRLTEFPQQADSNYDVDGAHQPRRAMQAFDSSHPILQKNGKVLVGDYSAHLLQKNETVLVGDCSALPKRPVLVRNSSATPILKKQGKIRDRKDRCGRSDALEREKIKTVLVSDGKVLNRFGEW